MMLLRWLGVLTLALLLSMPQLNAAPVAPAESALAVVPAGSPIVIQVRGFHRTLDRLKTLLSNALPEQAPKLKAQLDELIKQALENRQLMGLAPEAPIFVVFTSLPDPGDTIPPVAVVARVLDYTLFRDRLLTEDERKTLKKEAGYETVTPPGEQTIYFVRSREHTVLTPRKDVADLFLGRPASLTLRQEQATRLLNGDVGVYVDLDAVTRKYGDQIKASRDMLTAMFKSAPGGARPSALSDFMKQTIEAEFQVALDSRSLVQSLDFQPEGLAMHLTAEFAPDSPTDRIVKRFTRSSFKELDKLPSGTLGYAAAATTPELVKMFGAWLHGLMGPGTENRTFKEAMEQLAAAGPRWWLASYDGPGHGLQVWHYEHPEKVAPAQLKMFEAASFMIKGKPQVRRNAETYRGFTLHHVHLTWDFDQIVTGFLPEDAVLTEKEKKEFRDQMKRQLGEGLNSWFGTDGKVCITVTGDDWNDARRQIARYLDGKDTLEQQAAYRDIRKHLPEEATGFYLMDASHYDQLRALFAGPLAARDRAVKAGKTAPPHTGKPSYLSMAIGLQARRGDFDLWLPGPAVQVFYEMFQAAVKEAGPP
jgi:hypothetical protein